MAQQKIEFANTLRGLAALSVMLVHYVVMFNHLRGAYGGFDPLPFEPYPYLVPAIHFWLPMVDYGSLGVALFFLVSGFVIPFSLDRLGVTVRGRTAFLIARAFRLWPTYLAAIGVTFASLFAIAAISGVPRSYSWIEIIAQLSLFRDWLGTTEIGGITWTLEVEVKFYLLAAIFAPVLLFRPWLVILGVGALAALGGALGVKLPQAGPHWTNLLFAPQFVSFMLIGTGFHLHMKGRFPTLHLIGLILGTMAIFCAFQYRVYAENYSLAVAIFGACYLLRDHFRENRVTSFLANISYPLYVMHATFGYLGLRVMMGAGVPPVLALVVQMAVAMAVAYAIHRTVEVPTKLMGKEVADHVASNRRATRRQPAE